MSDIVRRANCIFLCSVPLLVSVVVGVRALRIPGIYQALGVTLFAAIIGAAWLLGARAIRASAEAQQRMGLVAGLFLLPFALVSLLWVGLGTPGEASPAENKMRFLVLLIGSIAVTGGFAVLEQALREAGERLYLSLGSVANILAGAAYLVWASFHLGGFVLEVQDGQRQTLPAVLSPSEVFDPLLFIACVLTYLATLIFAMCMGRVAWLGRGMTRVFALACVAALVALAIRGVSYPEPTAGATPWYIHPGFVAGIPIVPWMMPLWLGLVVLRRADDAQQ
jgi:cytochrome bd-type quinol oxidase subunit 2